MDFQFDNWYQDLTKSNVIMSYQGEITSSLIEKTLDDVELVLKEKGLKKKKIKKHIMLLWKNYKIFIIML